MSDIGRRLKPDWNAKDNCGRSRYALRMLAKLMGLLVVTALTAMANASWATTYFYTGTSFTSASGVYTTSMSVSGFLIYSAPLGSDVDVFSSHQGSDFGLTDFSFTDGLHTITKGNATDWGISIATDAAGNIDQWRVDLQKFNRDNPSLEFNIGILTCFNPLPSHPASGGLCGDLGARGSGGNEFIDLGLATTADPGAWTVPLPPSIGLLFTGLMLLGLFGRRRRAGTDNPNSFGL
jgi:hypothetical protein